MSKSLVENNYDERDLLKIPFFEYNRPHEILGPHKMNDKWFVTSFLPDIKSAEIIINVNGEKRKSPMSRVYEDNSLFRGEIPESAVHNYSLSVIEDEGKRLSIQDCYKFISFDSSRYEKFLNGLEPYCWKIFGSKKKKINGKTGIEFTVWAPNAKAVSVVGDFNDWKENIHQMSNMNLSGIWYLFIPSLKENSIYKFAVKGADNEVRLKSDPYACYSQMRPDNASVVYGASYKWKDNNWIKNRAAKKHVECPISIYEVHLSSWKRDSESDNEWGFVNYKTLAIELSDYAVEMGYTHIELLPIMEHPLDKSWGYQVINYFAPTSRFGKPEEFKYFVDLLHSKGIGVILDWVPAHFPTDLHGIADFDGTSLYSYVDPKKAFHKDWGTLVFDYGKPQVRSFLVSNALYWLKEYHIDALRVDAVASMLYLDYSKEPGEWEPNIYGGRENLEAVEFIKLLNETIHKKCKGVLMIAEESTTWPGVSLPVYLGGLGFDMKWNMGWMHDTLEYFSNDPIYRKFHHSKITFSMWYAYSEKFLLPFSHDEVVYGKKSLIEKMPGDDWQKFANLRLLFGYMFGHPGKKLNFMTNDFAQYYEWDSESELSLSDLEIDNNKKLQKFFKDLQNIYKNYKAFYELDFDSTGFNWIDFKDAENSVLSFIRYSKDKRDILFFTMNMTPVYREGYLFGAPAAGHYKEILNSDAEEYGGSGKGNLGGADTIKEPRYEWPYTLRLNLPPLAVNIYSYTKNEKENAE